MSLDIVLLGADGTPFHTASIGVHEHDRLMTLASHAGLQVVQRLHDYYADVALPADVVPLLLREVRTLRESRSTDSGVEQFLASLEHLCEEAVRDGRPLKAIAD
jgi:hypothetical protein